MSIFDTFGIDGLLISGGTNRRYFSGWSAEDHAPDRPSGVMLVTPAEKVLYASATNLPWAEAEMLSDVKSRALTDTWTKVLAEDIQAQGLRRVGFEETVIPVANFWQLGEVLGESVELVPVGGAVDALRAIKSPRELSLIQQALELTDIAFGRAADHLQGGMQERDLAAFIDQQFRDLGSDGQAFPTIVASGPNASRPHHSPGARVIQEGEPVIIDMGARVEGYCGDLTRTIWVGQPSERLATMYHLVAEAQQAAFAVIKHGIETRVVDQAARSVFAAAGFEEQFVHGLGHAIGLRIHEFPFCDQRSREVLQSGNVVTVEPGLYFPDWGGVRIEDVVVVEGDGYQNLTKAPKLLGN